MYVLFSIIGGMLIYFFFFEILLKVFQTVFWPIRRSDSFSPSFFIVELLRLSSKFICNILNLTNLVVIIIPSTLHPFSINSGLTRLMAVFNFGVIHGASLTLHYLVKNVLREYIHSSVRENYSHLINI